VRRWHRVCAIDDILPDTGVAAVVEGRAIAIFRVGGSVYALGSTDPFSDANVLARGIVGDAGGVLKVASPIYKQSFSLETGICLDDGEVAVPAYPARVRDGAVEVELPLRERRSREFTIL
jgi:nitrite reductase (NADH) small subunit